jgi:hypothetical protein
MNIIALIVLALAALVEGVVFVGWNHPKVSPRIPRLHALALFLFITGVILVAMFQFALVSPAT